MRNRQLLPAAHARGNDFIGGLDLGCGSHDTPLSHMGEGSASVGVGKVGGLALLGADEMQRLVLKSNCSF